MLTTNLFIIWWLHFPILGYELHALRQNISVILYVDASLGALDDGGSVSSYGGFGTGILCIYYEWEPIDIA